MTESTEQIKPNLPDKVMLTRGDILNSNLGVTRRKLKAAVKSGAIRSVKTDGYKWAHYDKNEVLRAFTVSLP